MTDIYKYDVVYVDLEGAVGSEQGKKRYAVVIQNDTGNRYAPTTLIMPLTTAIKSIHMPTHTVIKKSHENGLKANSMILAEQMRVVSEKRILKKFGNITDPNERKEIRRCYEAIFGED